MTEAAKIQSIYRYPVKGLSPEPLSQAHLGVGATVPGDRLYAIENGPSGFDPAAPRYQPKQRYLMLMRNERLATLRTPLSTMRAHTLVIELEGREAARGDLRTPAGRAAIEQFFASFAQPICADRRNCCMRPASASRMSRARWFPSSTSLPSGAGSGAWRAGRSAALSRQCLCERLAGLARIRSDRAADRDRRKRTAQDRQADRPLRRHRGRSGHWHPRSCHSADADAELSGTAISGSMPR